MAQDILFCTTKSKHNIYKIAKSSKEDWEQLFIVREKCYTGK